MLQPRTRSTCVVILALLWATLLTLSFSVSAHSQGGDKTPVAPSAPTAPLGQNLRFERLAAERGLSSNEVTSILHDSRGFIWFGTSGGLVRYDGYEFRTFKHDPQDGHTLSSNSVQALFEDQAGALWIGTEDGGLNRLDRATEQFAHYRHDPDDPNSLGSDRVLAIHQDQQGKIWIGTEGGGLNELAVGQAGGMAHFIRHQHDPDEPQSLSDNSATAIHRDQQGTLWVGTADGGLNRCQQATGFGVRIRCSSYQHDPRDRSSLRSNRITFIHEDGAGVLWIGTWGGGLERLDPQTGKPKAAQFTHYQHDAENPDSLSDNNVLSIHQDEAGSLWLGTARGLDHLDPQAGYGRDARFAHILPDPNDTYGLNHPVVAGMTGDRSGNLWLGTLGGGAHRLDLEAKPFAHLRSNPQDPNSLASNDVGAVYEDRTGVLWIGTRGAGLDRLDRQAGQVIHYAHVADDPLSLSDDTVRAIVEDRSGMLWIGTSDGLNRFDRETEEFVTYRHDPADPSSLSDNSIRALHDDHTGALWVGTDSGLDRFEPETGQAAHFRHDPSDPHSLSSDSVRTLYEDRVGVLWIGSSGGGLNRLDLSEVGASEPQAQRFTRYQHRPGDPQSLGDNDVSAILQDTYGVLWIGTANGLDRLDLETGQFVHYGANDGLPGASVLGILEEFRTPDLGGPNLWLSTMRGLSRLNPQTETFRNYDVSDGLQGNRFTESVAHKSARGEMYFGGPGGLTFFFPSEILDSHHVPPIAITGFQLSNRPVEIGDDSVLQRSIGETDHLKLAREDRDISFEFAALDFRAPEKNLYRYMLEGFDEGWIETDSDRRHVTYTNLDPGKYVFTVTGSNNDGFWNEEGVSVRLTITTPWWATWWFRGAVLLLLAVAAVLGLRWWLRSRRARSRERRAEAASRTEALETQITGREETEQRLLRAHDELATVLAVSRDMTSTLGQEQLLNLILDQSRSVLAYDGATIMTLTGDILKPRAYAGLAPGIDPRSLAIRVVKVLPLRRLVVERRPFIVGDILQEPGLSPEHLEAAGQDVQALFGQSRSWMGVPMIASNRVIGVLSLTHRTPEFYQDSVLELAQTFANLAAIAVENTLLYRHAQEMAALEERAGLARELHDSATCALYSALQFTAKGRRLTAAGDLEAARHYDGKVDESIHQALKEMRLMMFELQPPDLETEGLVGALQLRLDTVENHVGTQAHLDAGDLPDLPREVAEGLYDIAIEALNNVLKYAQAGAVKVTLRSKGEDIAMEVVDYSMGFDPDAVPDGRSLDLVGVQERVQALGGELTVDTTPGEGTKVRVTVGVGTESLSH